MRHNPSPIDIDESKAPNIARIGCNYHLYVAWYFLRIIELYESGNKDDRIWLPWVPSVLSNRGEGYREIVRSLSVLLRLDILLEITMDYVTFSPKDGSQIVYKSKTIKSEYFEAGEDGREEERLFDLNASLFEPKLDLVRFAILLDREKAKGFVSECLACWSRGETAHPEFSFVIPAKQKEVVLRNLEEKFALYGDLDFIFDRSEIPSWADSFATLLVLEKEGLINLYPRRKKIESESDIPKTFQVSLARNPEIARSATELKEVLFSYHCGNDVFRFRGEVIRLNGRNMSFVREFFDLLKDLGSGVDCSELLEAMETSAANLEGEERRRMTKNYIYDQRGRLNDKIQEQTRISEFFNIGNNRIYLSNPHCIEVT